MATNDTTAKTPTLEQTRIAMDEIAQKANSLHEICVEAVVQLNTKPEHVEESMRMLDVYLDAARNLAQTIGYIADAHGGCWKGDADKWFMPPTWHRENESTDNHQSAA
ncbi:MAG: hypothetical protein CME43_16425 [Haliea sp.]|uniref:hypothetical protein n=1 Tax=Haliea sp. TaxID=1932666 RepID=UPI000C415471|nr:hypothetical protein [Haliea sp.]MBM71048.1 hypothetical protein [Haliea sp.]|tara:strand:- start:2758 stop:3081 length:324 start_codon:yes stop_codon:yes gene_type:complete